MLPASQLERLIEKKEQRANKSSLNLSMINTRWVIRQHIILLLPRSVNRFQVFMSWNQRVRCPDTHQPRHKSAPQDIPGYQHAAGGRLAFGSRRTYRTATGKWVWGWGWGEIITIWAHRHSICLGGHTCLSYRANLRPLLTRWSRALARPFTLWHRWVNTQTQRGVCPPGNVRDIFVQNPAILLVCMNGKMVKAQLSSLGWEVLAGLVAVRMLDIFMDKS